MPWFVPTNLGVHKSHKVAFFPLTTNTVVARTLRGLSRRLRSVPVASNLSLLFILFRWFGCGSLFGSVCGNGCWDSSRGEGRCGCCCGCRRCCCRRGGRVGVLIFVFGRRRGG